MIHISFLIFSIFLYGLISSFNIRLFKSPIFKLSPNSIFHHSLILSNYNDSTIYVMDYIPIISANQSLYKNYLKLFIGMRMRGSVRLRNINNISFYNNDQILLLIDDDSQFSNNNTLIDLRDCYMKNFISDILNLSENNYQLYRENCQTFVKKAMNVYNVRYDEKINKSK